MVKDKEEMCLLLDKYKDLLTPLQSETMQLYYYDDMSLNEISIELKKTKQAVKDCIEKSISILFKFETVLKLVDKSKKYWKLSNNKNTYKDNEYIIELTKLLED